MAGRFDEFFLTVCKEAGGIEGLLDAFFDFMRRRTDFFYEMEPGDTMGFPPTVNTRMLLNSFKKQQEQHYKKFPKKDPAQYQQKLEKFRQNKQSKTKEVQKQKQQPQTPQIQVSDVKANKKQQQPKQKIAESASKQEVPISPQSQNQEKKSAQIISSYNGGTTDKYIWSQESRDIVVTIPLPAGTKAKELDVKIQTQHLKVVLKKTQQVLIEGDFYQKVRAGSNDSTWTVENSGGKSTLVLNLEKADQRIWSTILKGDPEIDTTKVNNTKNLSDFDEETQAAVQKLRFDQDQKMKGLPTSDQLKQRELLEKAWNAQGSPFKGSAFDPSKINMQGFNPSA